MSTVLGSVVDKGVGVGVTVRVAVGVEVTVCVGVIVTVGVFVGVAVAVGVGDAVGVSDGTGVAEANGVSVAGRGVAVTTIGTADAVRLMNRYINPAARTALMKIINAMAIQGRMRRPSDRCGGGNEDAPRCGI